MTGEIVNLNRARKARARAEDAARAAENRALFGRTKAEKIRDSDKAERLKSHLDGHRRDPGPEQGKP